MQKKNNYVWVEMRRNFLEKEYLKAKRMAQYSKRGSYGIRECNNPIRCLFDLWHYIPWLYLHNFTRLFLGFIWKTHVSLKSDIQIPQNSSNS